ncbi:MAG: hypothetical protein JWQ45_1293 [Blastococcus sp.]|jgi:hypothetical protein|nr:hypothetical protein [Blastococcus sp.]
MPPIAGEVIASPGPRRPPRPPTRSGAIRSDATVVAAAVAAGFALTVTTVPTAPTPQRVAESFVRALFDEDWTAARQVLCQSDRDRLDYPTFARRLVALNGDSPMPSDVDLELNDVRAGRGPDDPQIRVRITATSDERHREDWALTGDVPLLLEDGAVRVCFTAVTGGP